MEPDAYMQNSHVGLLVAAITTQLKLLLAMRKPMQLVWNAGIHGRLVQ